MTEDYCKLVSGIILSTIWREDDHTRLLWVTMLALKDRHHEVHASIPGLATVANLPVESVRASLLKLMQPDPDSRTKDNEGRRIREVEGGWFIVNGEKYRNYLSKAERNEYQRKLMAERRSKEPKLAPVRKKLAPLAHTEAEADTDTKAEAKSTERPSGYAVPACFENVEGFSVALAGWIEMRKKKKNPPTGTAIQIIIDRLSERPRDAVAALRLGIERGWTGMKWEWFDNERGRPSSGGLHENELHEKIKSKIITVGNHHA